MTIIIFPFAFSPFFPDFGVHLIGKFVLGTSSLDAARMSGSAEGGSGRVAGGSEFQRDLLAYFSHSQSRSASSGISSRFPAEHLASWVPLLAAVVHSEGAPGPQLPVFPEGVGAPLGAVRPPSPELPRRLLSLSWLRTVAVGGGLVQP